jgi:type III secretory pathway component EscS
MILLQLNTKRREPGEKCHAVTMMHRKPVKLSKWTHIMCRLRKWSTQNGMNSVTARIAVKAQKERQATINASALHHSPFQNDFFFPHHYYSMSLIVGHRLCPNFKWAHRTTVILLLTSRWLSSTVYSLTSLYFSLLSLHAILFAASAGLIVPLLDNACVVQHQTGKWVSVCVCVCVSVSVRVCGKEIENCVCVCLPACMCVLCCECVLCCVRVCVWERELRLFFYFCVCVRPPISVLHVNNFYV